MEKICEFQAPWGGNCSPFVCEGFIEVSCDDERGENYDEKGRERGAPFPGSKRGQTAGGHGQCCAPPHPRGPRTRHLVWLWATRTTFSLPIYHTNLTEILAPIRYISCS